MGGPRRRPASPTTAKTIVYFWSTLDEKSKPTNAPAPVSFFVRGADVAVGGAFEICDATTRALGIPRLLPTPPSGDRFEQTAMASRDPMTLTHDILGAAWPGCYRQSLLGVFEWRQHFKPYLRPARQYDLVVGVEPVGEAVIPHDHHVGAQSEETPDR